MKKSITLLVSCLLYTVVGLQAQVTLLNDKTKSSITYSMNHTLHSWTGLSNDVTSIIVTDNQKQTITTVTIAVNVSSFDSKNSFRDSRMMKVTEALKFPKITFSSTAIKHTNNKVMVEGLLSFHGITKPITLEAISKQSNNMLKVTGTFIINMKDFNIDPPRLLGIATDDVIKLTFSIVY